MDVGYERGINQESTLAPCVNYLSHNGFKIIEFKYSINRIVILLKNTKIKICNLKAPQKLYIQGFLYW